ncbi:regulatory protein RecX [Thermoflavifilum thermophilum]|uniref:Regulatory protein RecX n=1 Tax=Thermoflavifilum thermophilum TaxID=1393122 RepID=A0A1I7N9B5_9BACT|nr:regulatory protein RecX [Thermoflavifilum thermophilum]SFV31257.1 regulatory protein [Thermoflavifilum thermophilum]
MSDCQHIKQSVIWKKITHYCAYQERCHQEVKQKLYQLGVYGQQAETYIACLIEENYLNEERFAIQFALGKFNINKWGKRKIASALQQKQISPYLIKKALAQIDTDQYLKVLEKQMQSKIAAGRNLSAPLLKQKIMSYFLQKGYEAEYIEQIWNHIQDLQDE